MFLPPQRVQCPRRAARVLAAAVLLAAAVAPARAQDLELEALPGTDAERYLRALQVAGETPVGPWSLRGFSPREMRAMLPADSAHPWAARVRPAGDGVRLVRPRADLGWNSAFAYGQNDGAVWAGRGLTARGSAGAAARWGVLSLRVEPVAFWTQNGAYDLMPTGTGEPFADPVTPAGIDLPQRFGDEAYRRVDPGESLLRLDVRGVVVGVGTESQHWGPAIDQPLLLGPNAAGFAHAFVGTSAPRNVWIGRVHARLVWGRLDQSPWSLAPDSVADRFMSGFTATFQPRGMEGLELGVARFFHLPLTGRRVTLGDVLRPVEPFFKSARSGPEGEEAVPENQLASVFARWVLPRAGAEVYGEYIRDDHNWNLRDFLLEPDHSAGYLLGASRAWRSGRSLVSARAEWVNTQASHLREARNQGRLYRNGSLPQGHTQRGQLLGSEAGYGGGGSVVALDVFHPGGRWSMDWTRTRVRDNWGGTAATEQKDDAVTDVIHSLGAEALFFRGPVDARASLRGSWELNRQFGDDAFNLTASVGMRIGL
ncbi:capsule assembly Wzi family protein [Longimicrobium sp.]|uniref:capsule assembly Wzi family protein n=1 Tax=Longimicrobium sp. TaxID=2029185 RepID=UPI002E381C6F|nr:capsule assembly Wzi family protein [Longimicrobium sp.]HEX6037002.1 capsule assembly Wzi family protein [Longimicrobium sp.]